MINNKKDPSNEAEIFPFRQPAATMKEEIAEGLVLRTVPAAQR